jgi:hypothetical protein
MEYDKDKVDEVTLALLYLVMHDEDEYGARAWKGFDWDTMNRLHERGFIGNPVGKTKSVVSHQRVTEQELFKHLGNRVITTHGKFSSLLGGEKGAHLE